MYRMFVSFQVYTAAAILADSVSCCYCNHGFSLCWLLLTSAPAVVVVAAATTIRRVRLCLYVFARSVAGVDVIGVLRIAMFSSCCSGALPCFLVVALGTALGTALVDFVAADIVVGGDSGGGSGGCDCCYYCRCCLLLLLVLLRLIVCRCWWLLFVVLTWPWSLSSFLSSSQWSWSRGPLGCRCSSFCCCRTYWLLFP